MLETHKNFGCKTHHRVFFSLEALNSHLAEGCHIENISPLEGEDPLGRGVYNLLSTAIDAQANTTEAQKEELRQAYGLE